MSMIEELHHSYRFYYQNYNREPNALVLGFRQKGNLIRECMQMHPTVPLDMPPLDGSPMTFMGCEVIETVGNTMRFAFVGDDGCTPNARPHAEAVADSVQADVGATIQQEDRRC